MTCHLPRAPSGSFASAMARWSATPSASEPPRMRARQVFSLAWRESRTARRRLALYMSSISLGAAALVAIDSFAANMTTSVREQARALLGGDVSVTSRQPLPPPVEELVDSIAQAGSVKVTEV